MIFDVNFGDFDVIFGWDWGIPAIYQQNPNKITLLYGCGFGLKKLELGQTPAPLLGTKSQLLPKISETDIKTSDRLETGQTQAGLTSNKTNLGRTGEGNL